MESALEVWQKELANSKSREEIIKLKFLLSESYASLKDYERAKKELQNIVNLDPEPEQLALVLEKQGNIEQIAGNSNQALELYQKSLEINKNLPSLSLSLLNNSIEVLEERINKRSFKLGQSRSQKDRNTYQNLIKRDRELIQEYAELASRLSKELIPRQLTAYTKRLSEAVPSRNPLESKEQQKKLLSAVIASISWDKHTEKTLSEERLSWGAKVLGTLPTSRKLIFTTIEWSELDTNNQESWLKKAITRAEESDDRYAESYALNALGRFYLATSQLENAIEAAIKSQKVAQSIFAYDSLFRSQSLAGQIYQQTGQTQKAIEAYRGAIDSIDTSIEQNSQYNRVDRLADFKNELEPIYRNSLKLLLNSKNLSQEDLTEALNIFDRLRLAQLRRYFGDNCLEILEAKEMVNSSLKSAERTVSLDSIILDDSTHFILEMPDGRKMHNVENIGKNDLSEIARRWKTKLTKAYNWEFRKDSRLFYDWIIKPFEAELEEQDIETIVFVHDGILRNLPMAALYDGEQYLAERWASISSLGLKVTPTNTTKKKLIQALAFGLSNPRANLGEFEYQGHRFES